MPNCCVWHGAWTCQSQDCYRLKSKNGEQLKNSSGSQARVKTKPNAKSFVDGGLGFDSLSTDYAKSFDQIRQRRVRATDDGRGGEAVTRKAAGARPWTREGEGIAQGGANRSLIFRVLMRMSRKPKTF